MMKRLAALAAATAVTVSVVAGGTASASPRSGTQHFLLRETDFNQSTSVVVARGPITATGIDVVISDTRDRFVFPQGNLIIDHQPTSTEDSFNPRTCTARFEEEGTYQIVRGTGKYDDVSGHGTYEVNVLVVGCDENNPERFLLTIKASGPIAFNDD